MIGYLCAMLRYYYPLEFITAFLNTAANEDDIRMGTNLAKQKGIKIKPILFGKSQAEYAPNKEENAIYQGIASIKYLNHQIAEELYDLAQNNTYNSCTELLLDITEKTSVNARQLDILIKLNFFKQFGKIERLLAVYDNFVNGKYRYKKTHKQDTKDKRIPKLIEWENETDDIIEFSTSDQIMFEKEVLGYVQTKFNVPKSECIVVDINSKYTPIVTFHQMQTGKEITAKIKKKTFYTNEGELCSIGDRVKILDTFTDFKWRKGESGFYQDKSQKELFVSNLQHIK